MSDIRMRCPLCNAESTVEIEQMKQAFPVCARCDHDMFPAGAVGRPDVPVTIHRAKHCTEAGAVSPLCAPEPTPITGRFNYWSVNNAAVNCARCRALIEAGASAPQH